MTPHRSPSLVATFAREEDLVSAARECRRRGLRIVDAYTPCAVHGLDEALGLRPSRLTWVCAAFGAAGACAILWFQEWTSAVNWPINVGGKPFDSLPAFMPAVFETMVLAAGLGTVFAFLAASRLWPGRQAETGIEGVTDDRFALVLQPTDASLDAEEAAAELRRMGAETVEQRLLAGPARGSAAGPPGTGLARRNLNLALLAALAAGVVACVAMPRDRLQRNWEFLPEMVWSPGYDALGASADLSGGITLQPPVPGAIARGQQPLDYQATEEDELRAGRELSNPFPASDAAAQKRGAFVYENFCTSCHGASGQGDGPVAKRGYPPPPSLLTGNSLKMPDGQLFHVVTYGRKNMPPHAAIVLPEDRWKAILHVRTMQSQAPPAAPPATQPLSSPETPPGKQP